MAKVRTSKLIDHLCSLYRLQEANAIINYSDVLVEQISRTRATEAFEQFRTSQFLFQVIRLCALWDGCREDRESIPTIVDLIDSPSIIATVTAERHASHMAARMYDLSPSDDPEIERAKREWFQRDREEHATIEAERSERHIKAAVALAREVQAKPILKKLQNFRDQYIAHNLDLPVQHGNGPRYGDERYLIRRTVKIADWLHKGLSDTSFLWLDARRQARREARALWINCRFNTDPKA